MIVGMVLNTGCRKGQPVGVTYTMPPSLALMKYEEAKMVTMGEETVLFIEGAVTKDWQEQPEEVIDRMEVLIDGKVVREYGPEILIEGYCPPYIKLRGNCGISQIGFYFLIRPGEYSKTRKHELVVRVYKKGMVAEDSMMFYHDDGRVRELAEWYILNFMVGTHPEKYNPGYHIERMSSKRIYVYVDALPAEIGELVLHVLDDVMRPYTGLRFIQTHRVDVKPIIIYQDGAKFKPEEAIFGVSLCEEGNYPVPTVNPSNPYEIWCAIATVYDSRVPGISMHIKYSAVLHETGHVIGLPHSEGGIDDFMAFGGGSVYMPPFEQVAIRMVYSKPPGYSWKNGF